MVSHGKDKHACDYVDDKGEEIETSLAVQLDSSMNLKTRDDDDTVEGARAKFSQMQAQMDAAVASADEKRAAQ